jgi:hypothetical protein
MLPTWRSGACGGGGSKVRAGYLTVKAILDCRLPFRGALILSHVFRTSVPAQDATARLSDDPAWPGNAYRDESRVIRQAHRRLPSPRRAGSQPPPAGAIRKAVRPHHANISPAERRRRLAAGGIQLPSPGYPGGAPAPGRIVGGAWCSS